MSLSAKPTIDLSIHSIGGMGDGIADYKGKTVFVPYSCAGDVIKATIINEKKDYIRAALSEIIHPSSDRQVPICQHFGVCGGCSFQHLSEFVYYQHKYALLTQIAKELGYDTSIVRPVVRIGPASRRRVDLKINLHKGEIRIGFFSPKSHNLIELKECPVSDDRLMALLPALKDIFQRLKKPGIIHGIHLTHCDHGFDAILYVKSRVQEADRQMLIAFAQSHCIIRLSEAVADPSAESSTPADLRIWFDSGKATVQFGDVTVKLPAGAFLQATRNGQLAITQAVIRYVSGCRHIADLYAGCGTYSFPLVQHVQRVTAFEGAAEMSLAMHNAILSHQLEDRVHTVIRDLFREPLLPGELVSYDGIVINPPRNGALPQVQAIAKSTVNTIAMVSCNPASFARDARCLIHAGFHLKEMIPIDQFYWTNHLELVAHFQR